MAVEFISSVTFNTDSDNGSQELTIPSDCTFVLVSFADYVSASDGWVSGVIGSNDLTLIAETDPSASVIGWTGMAYLVNPATGSQTMNLQFHNDRDTVGVCVSYWKGVDTSDPIKDYDLQGAPSSYGTNQTVECDAMDCAVGDAAVVGCFSNSTYADATPTTPSDYGQTAVCSQIVTSSSRSHHCGYKIATAAGTIVVAARGTYVGIVGIVLKALAAKAISPLILSRQRDAFHHMIIR